MNLLYCRNGLVFAIHDDNQPYVDPAAYGDGTRVIPWSQPLSDLTLSGPDLSPKYPPPLYEQPDETPEILLAYAAQVRFNTSTHPINFTTGQGLVIPVKTDRQSAALVNNLATHARDLADDTPLHFTQDNIDYQITAKDAEDMFDQMIQQVQVARNVEADCIADLTSPTPTILTFDDVDAKFAGIVK